MSVVMENREVYKHKNGLKFEILSINSETAILKELGRKPTYKVGIDYLTSCMQTEGGKVIGERFVKTSI